MLNVREKVGSDVRDGPVAERVDSDGHTLHDLVERRFPSPTVSLRRTEVAVLNGGGFFPGLILLVRGHERAEDIDFTLLFHGEF